MLTTTQKSREKERNLTENIARGSKRRKKGQKPVCA
jgi:hypothetical protein